MLRTAAAFDWNFIDGETYGQAVDSFMTDCDPKYVLAKRTTHGADVMNLMKGAYGLTANSYHTQMQVKHVAYIRCVVHMVCRCTHLVGKIDNDTFHPIIANTVTEVYIKSHKYI